LRDAGKLLDTTGEGRITSEEAAAGTERLRNDSDPAYRPTISVAPGEPAPFRLTYTREGATGQQTSALSNFWVSNQEAMAVKSAVARLTGEADVLAVGGGAPDAIGLSFDEMRVLHDAATATPVVVAHEQHDADFRVSPNVPRKDFFRQEVATGFLANGERVVITSSSPTAYPNTERDQSHRFYAEAAATMRAMYGSTRLFNMAADTKRNNEQVWRTLEARGHEPVARGQARLVDYTGSLMNDTKITGEPVRWLIGKAEKPGTPGVNGVKEGMQPTIRLKEPSDGWKVVLMQRPVRDTKGAVTGWELELSAYVVPNLEILPTTKAVIDAFLDNRFGDVDFDARTVRDASDPSRTIPLSLTKSDVDNLARLKELQTLMRDVPVRVPVSEIERRTGLRFFEALPAGVRQALEPLKSKSGEARVTLELPVISARSQPSGSDLG
jgi:DNA/RNA endonuclease G (NUC1)